MVFAALNHFGKTSFSIQAAVLLKTLTTEKKTNREKKYQLSGDGGNLSLAATLHPLQHWTALPAKCKMPATGPQNG